MAAVIFLGGAVGVCAMAKGIPDSNKLQPSIPVNSHFWAFVLKRFFMPTDSPVRRSFQIREHSQQFPMGDHARN
jgi:hypothetical protein